ncbi:MAG: hypothetical protein IPN90_03545 [Elusimicrobia bacterium]|nr:hypothetical protein [Elusimicrobiota bacterium]
MTWSETYPFFQMFPRVRPFLFVRWLIGLSFAAGAVYGALFLETGARARSSFSEAERFRRWAMDPAEMNRDLEIDYLKAIEWLAAQKERGEITAGGLRLERDILQARFNMRRAESPAKRAYFSYRDVYRLYSPPETESSRRARLWAPAAKQAWRENVDRRGFPVSSEIYDPEPGETGDRRVVFSTRERFMAMNLVAILQSKGVAADLFDDAPFNGAGRPEYGVTVPSSNFWRAHQELASLLAPDLPAVFQKS